MAEAELFFLVFFATLMAFAVGCLGLVVLFGSLVAKAEGFTALDRGRAEGPSAGHHEGLNSEQVAGRPGPDGVKKPPGEPRSSPRQGVNRGVAPPRCSFCQWLRNQFVVGNR